MATASDKWFPLFVLSQFSFAFAPKPISKNTPYVFAIHLAKLCPLSEFLHQKSEHVAVSGCCMTAPIMSVSESTQFAAIMCLVVFPARSGLARPDTVAPAFADHR